MSDMEKEIVLVTGCSGFIGFPCMEKLQEHFQIIGIDTALVGHLPGVELIGIDLGSEINIRENLGLIREKFGKKIHSVIHLAAYYNFSKGHWSKYESITIRGTKTLLEELKTNFEVGQFIFSSSMLVYAPCNPGEKITEESPLLPKWNYPKSKVITENLIREMHGDIPFVILRIAGVYNDICHSIPLAHQVQRIYENSLEGHVFPGHLDHGDSFIHVDDLVEVICEIVYQREKLPPELVLLLGEERTLSYDELQKEIARLIWNRDWKTWRIPKFLGKIGAFIKQHFPFMKKGFIEPWMVDLADDHYELDISKAKKLLGWEPKHTLQSTIPKWIEMLNRDPVAWYDMNHLTGNPSKHGKK